MAHFLKKGFGICQIRLNPEFSISNSLIVGFLQDCYFVFILSPLFDDEQVFIRELKLRILIFIKAIELK